MQKDDLGKVAFVCTGGGFNGAFTVGALKALSEQGIKPSYMFGVSVGAINAATFIAGDCQSIELEKAWRWLDRQKDGHSFLFNRMEIPGRVLWWRRKPSLFSNDGLKKLVNGSKEKDFNLTGINIKAVMDSPIRLDIGIRNETRGSYEIFSNRDKDIRENPEKLRLVLEGTACLPGFLEPVEIDKEWYSDGVYVKLKPAIAKYDCKTVFLISNDQPMSHKDAGLRPWWQRIFYPYLDLYDKVFEFALRVTYRRNRDLVIPNCADVDLPFMEGFRRALKEDDTLPERSGEVDHRLIVIAPEKCAGEISTLSFVKGAIGATIDHGYEVAESVIQKILSEK